MTLPRLSLLAFASVAFATSLFADTVVLKNGTKIEGKITKETDTQLTIETKAGGIIDEQTFKKDEVQSVSKTTADEEAYAPLRGLKLGANSLPSAAQYDNSVSALKSFVSQYPDSKHKAEIEKLAAEFEAEQKRVADGEVKLDGKWLGKAEVEREKYQINAMVALGYMKEQAARNDATGAMNTFEALRKQYPGSRGYIEAVDMAKRLVPALKQQADVRIARLPVELAEREKTLATAAGASKVELQNEIDRERKANDAAIAQAKAQNLRWPPFLPRNEEALKQISQLSADEASQLASVDVAKARQSIQLAAEARAALDKKNLTLAEEKARAARDAWNDNEIAARLDTEISNAKAASDAAKAETAEAPAPAPAPAVTKVEEKPAEPEPAAETTSESGDASASTAAAAEEEEGNPAFRIILIIIIAAVAIVGFKAYRSIRKKSSELIE